MRARINERLASATRFPVTLIVAPAGFGKSVALRDFLEHAAIEAVRFDVRREDGTLLAFVRSFSEALEPVAPSAIAAFPAMQERVLAAQEPVRQISDWFAEHLKSVRATIAIDDLHYASTDPASIALLADLIERTTGRISWIIAARSDVGLPIATWIAYGRMDMPIGEDELRFTTDEALIAAEQAHTKIDLTEIEALRQLTEGWPVALTIALRTRTHSADLRTASFGTREMVYRYLAEQVFSALTLQQRAFALASSVLSSFDAATAQALGATPEFVSELRSKIAFLNESEPGVYRYHELFRDFLETELRRTGEAEWNRAVRHAAQLLERRGFDADALLMYAKARASSDILRIIERSGFSLFERGQSEEVASALAAVPQAERDRNAPALGLRAMLDASRGHFELAQPQFLEAINAASDPALKLTIVHRYAIELVRNGRDSVDLLEPFASDDTLAPGLRVPLLGTLATGYVMRHGLDRAVATVDSALALQVHSSEDVRARLFQQAAHVYQNAGVKDRAENYARMAIDLAIKQNLYEVAARAYSVLYNLKYDDDDMLASLDHLENLADCARKAATARTWLYGVVASYDIQAEMGNEAALAALDATLEQNQSSLPPNSTESLLPALAMRQAWHGEFRQAYELLKGTAPQQSGMERRALRAAETALYAMAAGLHAEGAAAVAEAEADLEHSHDPTRRTIRARIILALAHLVGGQSAQAHRLLTAAEQSLKPEMRRLRSLCAGARAAYRLQLQQTDRQEWEAALHRLESEHFGGFARVMNNLPLGSSGNTAFSALTPAEREILALLAKGASTKDVANHTGRSPHTVDTHIRSMCRKLGCSGRREAVALATRQGWVQT